jgi:RNA polymerase-binding transcription factor DksA
MSETPEKTRYNDEELVFFKELIEKKLAISRDELSGLSKSLRNSNEHGTDDTASNYTKLDEGTETLEKEQLGIMAQRTKKFIENLELALIRIQNKTFGICRVTGKLIPKERLMAVPHATLSIEAKNKQYK